MAESQTIAQAIVENPATGASISIDLPLHRAELAAIVQRDLGMGDPSAARLIEVASEEMPMISEAAPEDIEMANDLASLAANLDASARERAAIYWRERVSVSEQDFGASANVLMQTDLITTWYTYTYYEPEAGWPEPISPESKYGRTWFEEVYGVPDIAYHNYDIELYGRRNSDAVKLFDEGYLDLGKDLPPIESFDRAAMDEVLADFQFPERVDLWQHVKVTTRSLHNGSEYTINLPVPQQEAAAFEEMVSLGGEHDYELVEIEDRGVLKELGMGDWDDYHARISSLNGMLTMATELYADGNDYERVSAALSELASPTFMDAAGAIHHVEEIPFYAYDFPDIAAMELSKMSNEEKWGRTLYDVRAEARELPEGREGYEELLGADFRPSAFAAQHDVVVGQTGSIDVYGGEELNLSRYEDGEIAQAAKQAREEIGVTAPFDPALTEMPPEEAARVAREMAEDAAMGRGEVPQRPSEEKDGIDRRRFEEEFGVPAIARYNYDIELFGRLNAADVILGEKGYLLRDVTYPQPDRLSAEEIAAAARDVEDLGLAYPGEASTTVVVRNLASRKDTTVSLPMAVDEAEALERELSHGGKDNLIMLNVEDNGLLSDLGIAVGDNVSEYSSLTDLNSVILLASNMDSDLRPAVEMAVPQVDSSSLGAYANLIYQAGDLPYLDYRFDGSDALDLSAMSLYEKWGRTLYDLRARDSVYAEYGKGYKELVARDFEIAAPADDRLREPFDDEAADALAQLNRKVRALDTAYLFAEIPETTYTIGVAEVSIDRSPSSEGSYYVFYDSEKRHPYAPAVADEVGIAPEDREVVYAAVRRQAPNDPWVRYGLERPVTPWGFKESGEPYTEAEYAEGTGEVDFQMIHPVIDHNEGLSLSEALLKVPNGPVAEIEGIVLDAIESGVFQRSLAFNSRGRIKDGLFDPAKVFGATTDNGYVYKNPVAFLDRGDDIAYIANAAWEEPLEADAEGYVFLSDIDPEHVYTYEKILQECAGSKAMAERVFGLLSWQHPSTVYDEEMRELVEMWEDADKTLRMSEQPEDIRIYVECALRERGITGDELARAMAGQTAEAAALINGQAEAERAFTQSMEVLNRAAGHALLFAEPVPEGHVAGAVDVEVATEDPNQKALVRVVYDYDARPMPPEAEEDPSYEPYAGDWAVVSAAVEAAFPGREYSDTEWVDAVTVAEAVSGAAVLPASIDNVLDANMAAARAMEALPGRDADDIAQEEVRETALEQDDALTMDYMMLDRLKSDCDYVLGAGGPGAVRQMWAHDIDELIAEMRRIWDRLPAGGKPEWLTMEDIDRYAARLSEAVKPAWKPGSIAVGKRTGMPYVVLDVTENGRLRLGADLSIYDTDMFEMGGQLDEKLVVDYREGRSNGAELARALADATGRPDLAVSRIEDIDRERRAEQANEHPRREAPDMGPWKVGSIAVGRTSGVAFVVMGVTDDGRLLVGANMCTASPDDFDYGGQVPDEVMEDIREGRVTEEELQEVLFEIRAAAEEAAKTGPQAEEPAWALGSIAFNPETREPLLVTGVTTTGNILLGYDMEPHPASAFENIGSVAEEVALAYRNGTIGNEEKNRAIAPVMEAWDAARAAEAPAPARHTPTEQEMEEIERGAEEDFGDYAALNMAQAADTNTPSNGGGAETAREIDIERSGLSVNGVGGWEIVLYNTNGQIMAVAGIELTETGRYGVELEVEGEKRPSLALEMGFPRFDAAKTAALRSMEQELGLDRGTLTRSEAFETAAPDNYPRVWAAEHGREMDAALTLASYGFDPKSEYVHFGQNGEWKSLRFNAAAADGTAQIVYATGYIEDLLAKSTAEARMTEKLYGFTPGAETRSTEALLADFAARPDTWLRFQEADGRDAEIREAGERFLEEFLPEQIEIVRAREDASRLMEKYSFDPDAEYVRVYPDGQWEALYYNPQGNEERGQIVQAWGSSLTEALAEFDPENPFFISTVDGRDNDNLYDGPEDMEDILASFAQQREEWLEFKDTPEQQHRALADRDRHLTSMRTLDTERSGIFEEVPGSKYRMVAVSEGDKGSEHAYVATIDLREGGWAVEVSYDNGEADLSEEGIATFKEAREHALRAFRAGGRYDAETLADFDGFDRTFPAADGPEVTNNAIGVAREQAQYEVRSVPAILLGDEADDEWGWEIRSNGRAFLIDPSGEVHIEILPERGEIRHNGQALEGKTQWTADHDDVRLALEAFVAREENLPYDPPEGATWNRIIYDASHDMRTFLNQEGPKLVRPVYPKGSIENFRQELDDALRTPGEFNVNETIYVSDTPALFVALGMEQRPILLNKNKVEALVHSKGLDFGENWHGLTREDLMMLPELIARPAMVLESLSPTNPDSIVLVFDAVDIDDIPLVAAIKPNVERSYEFEPVYANALLSVYGKENLESYIKRAVEQEKVLWIDKEKTEELCTVSQLQLLKAVPGLPLNQIIRQSGVIEKAEGRNPHVTSDPLPSRGKKAAATAGIVSANVTGAVGGISNTVGEQAANAFVSVQDQTTAQITASGTTRGDSDVLRSQVKGTMEEYFRGMEEGDAVIAGIGEPGDTLACVTVTVDDAHQWGTTATMALEAIDFVVPVRDGHPDRASIEATIEIMTGSVPKAWSVATVGAKSHPEIEAIALAAQKAEELYFAGKIGDPCAAQIGADRMLAEIGDESAPVVMERWVTSGLDTGYVDPVGGRVAVSRAGQLEWAESGLESGVIADMCRNVYEGKRSGEITSFGEKYAADMASAQNWSRPTSDAPGLGSRIAAAVRALRGQVDPPQVTVVNSAPDAKPESGAPRGNTVKIDLGPTPDHKRAPKATLVSDERGARAKTEALKKDAPAAQMEQKKRQ